MINSYAALDIETTGLNPAADKIIEIGVARIENGEVVDTYSELVNPQIQLSSRISELTGITDNMLCDKPCIGDIIEAVVCFIGDLPILGHNVIFDYSFIKKAAVNNKLTFDKEGIDTLKIARRLLPELPHKGLEYLCKHYGINPGNSHRALDDAISASKVFEEMKKINPEDKGFWAADKLNYTVKKDSPITPAQTSYLISLVTKHNIDLKCIIESLTKSQASKMIDGIISEYGK